MCLSASTTLLTRCCDTSAMALSLEQSLFLLVAGAASRVWGVELLLITASAASNAERSTRRVWVVGP